MERIENIRYMMDSESRTINGLVVLNSDKEL